MIGKSKISLFVPPLALVTSVALVACSSDDSAAPAQTPFDSGTVVVPEAGAQAPELIQVQVQGDGVVESADSHPDDAGTAGQVVCGSDAGTALCSAPQRAILYAIAADGWVFHTWTSTTLDAGVDLSNASNSYTVSSATPNPLIAVFIPQTTGGSGDGGTH